MSNKNNTQVHRRTGSFANRLLNRALNDRKKPGEITISTAEVQKLSSQPHHESKEIAATIKG